MDKLLLLYFVILLVNPNILFAPEENWKEGKDNLQVNMP